MQQLLGDVVAFVPKLLAFLAILLIGYFVAKAVAKATNAGLERVGFDNAVERSGVQQALARSQYDASDVLAKIVRYAIMLFVLQLAYGVFGALTRSAPHRTPLRRRVRQRQRQDRLAGADLPGQRQRRPRVGVG